MVFVRSRRCVTALLMALTASTAAHAEWPHSRGPRLDGSVAAPESFRAELLALDVDWRVEIGSGYSGVAVSGGLAITSFSHADGNWIGAYDVDSGKEAWRHRLGDIYKGRDGADDGPLSTPTIGNGRVFAIDPRGRLVALGLRDGSQLWQRQLDADFGSKSPEFGFTTSPLLEGDTLIVQSGAGEGRSIVGLDAESGALRWSHGDDRVQYQSPAAMTLAGRRQIVAVTNTKITGLAADDGRPLWEQPLGDGIRAGSATPTFVGNDRFLVLTSAGGAVFRVERSAEALAVRQLYVSESLGKSYAPPVYHDGFLYGFRGQILTCVNAADGERVWRSRPPGGDGLILVGDHLVIFGSDGNVVLAEASPDGYRERGRTQALDESSLTWPSYSDGRIFVRDLVELAAVRVRAAVPQEDGP